jgi:hypothetical protein
VVLPKQQGFGFLSNLPTVSIEGRAMKRILCVDDSRTSHMIVADAVKKLGFEMLEGVNGENGINHISTD